MKKEIIEQTDDHKIEFEHEQEVDTHSFKLNVNNGEFFINDYVLKVGLPQFHVENRIENKKILGKSSILVTLAHGPNIVSNLLKAAQSELNFNIEFLLNDEIYSVWELKKATIISIGLGELSKIGHDNPNNAFVECEVMFDSLIVDDVII